MGGVMGARCDVRRMFLAGLLGLGAMMSWADNRPVAGGKAELPAAAEYVVTDGDHELRVRATGVQQWLDDGATFGLYDDIYEHGSPHELTRAKWAGYQIVTISGC